MAPELLLDGRKDVGVLEPWLDRSHTLENPHQSSHPINSVVATSRNADAREYTSLRPAPLARPKSRFTNCDAIRSRSSHQPSAVVRSDGNGRYIGKAADRRQHTACSSTATPSEGP